MKRFGKFILLDCIGRGGTADIYRAKLCGKPQTLAIKCIQPDHIEEPELVQMFIDEARVLAMMRHPTIVEVVDLGMIDGCYFLAMEYVDGHPLIRLQQYGSRMPEHAISLPSALYVARQVALGLAFAHELHDAEGNPHCVVHRDISPFNIMVSLDGEVKIIDFGVAKVTRRMSKSRHGTLKGTCAYMSPEQARGEAVDPRSDIFSLGVVLHEMVTGEPLFGGDNELTVLDRVQRCQMTLATCDSHGIPERLEALFCRALAPEPAQRHATARELALELDAILQADGSKDPEISLGMVAKRVRREQKAKGETMAAFEQTPCAPTKGKSRDPLLDYFSQTGDVTLGEIREMLDSGPTSVLHRETISIDREEDIVLARRGGMTLAKNLKMNAKDVTIIGTVISELTRNVVRYAGRGQICIEVVGGQRPGIRLVISDEGPGIEAPPAEDAKHPLPSKHGMGMGLIGSRRLMDEFAVETSPTAGTVITAVKYT